MAAPKLSLAEVLEIRRQALGYKRIGRTPVITRGDVFAKLRDVDTGKVVKNIRQKNLATRYTSEMWSFYGRIISTSYIGISDDPNPMDLWKSAIRSSLDNDSVSNHVTIIDGTSLNLGARTYTYQVIFNQPDVAERTVRLICLSRYPGARSSGDFDSIITGIYAATKLTQPIVQGLAQTLEITYRLSFARG